MDMIELSIELSLTCLALNTQLRLLDHALSHVYSLTRIRPATRATCTAREGLVCTNVRHSYSGVGRLDPSHSTANEPGWRLTVVYPAPLCFSANIGRGIVSILLHELL